MNGFRNPIDPPPLPPPPDDDEDEGTDASPLALAPPCPPDASRLSCGGCAIINRGELLILCDVGAAIVGPRGWRTTWSWAFPPPEPDR